MATIFTSRDFPTNIFNRNRSGRCRYPWYSIQVNEGFYMSYEELGGKKRPDVPTKLTRQGQRWEFASIDKPDGNYEPGIFFKRVA
jgi:hypothetical protein